MRDDLAYWLTGLIDAAGTFTIYPSSCRFRLSLLAEDAAVLEDIRTEVGVGGVYPITVYGNTRPRFSWEVQSKQDCSALSRFLDQYPLRTSKQASYMVWRRAVAFWNSSEGTSEERREALNYLSKLLS